jgi:hypothetical protein
MKFKSEKETVFHFLFFSLFAREEIEMERGKKGRQFRCALFGIFEMEKEFIFL